MKLEIEIPDNVDEECTNVPYWIIIDPKAMGRSKSIDSIANAISGVWFNRKDAEDYLLSRRHAYSDKARVYCHSGHHSWVYAHAWEDARAKSKEATNEA